jgi:hypothetical protein
MDETETEYLSFQRSEMAFIQVPLAVFLPLKQQPCKSNCTAWNNTFLSSAMLIVVGP